MFELTVVGSWIVATVVFGAWVIGAFSRYHILRYGNWHINTPLLAAVDEVEQAITFLIFDLLIGAALGAVLYFWPMRGGAL